MSTTKYTFLARLFIITHNRIEFPVITIDGCEPDDTMYFYRKDANYGEREGLLIAHAIHEGMYRERLLDDVRHYNVDLWGYETAMDLYANVINGYKKALAST